MLIILIIVIILIILVIVLRSGVATDDRLGVVYSGMGPDGSIPRPALPDAPAALTGLTFAGVTDLLHGPRRRADVLAQSGRGFIQSASFSSLSGHLATIRIW